MLDSHVPLVIVAVLIHKLLYAATQGINSTTTDVENVSRLYSLLFKTPLPEARQEIELNINQSLYMSREEGLSILKDYYLTVVAVIRYFLGGSCIIQNPILMVPGVIGNILIFVTLQTNEFASVSFAYLKVIALLNAFCSVCSNVAFVQNCPLFEHSTMQDSPYGRFMKNCFYHYISTVWAQIARTVTFGLSFDRLAAIYFSVHYKMFNNRVVLGAWLVFGTCIHGTAYVKLFWKQACYGVHIPANPHAVFDYAATIDKIFTGLRVYYVFFQSVIFAINTFAIVCGLFLLQKKRRGMVVSETDYKKEMSVSKLLLCQAGMILLNEGIWNIHWSLKHSSLLVDGPTAVRTLSYIDAEWYTITLPRIIEVVGICSTLLWPLSYVSDFFLYLIFHHRFRLAFLGKFKPGAATTYVEKLSAPAATQQTLNRKTTHFSSRRDSKF